MQDWVQIPAYRTDLELTLGSTGCNDLRKAVDERLSILNRQAKILFENFLQIVKKSSNQELRA